MVFEVVHAAKIFEGGALIVAEIGRWRPLEEAHPRERFADLFCDFAGQLVRFLGGLPFQQGDIVYFEDPFQFVDGGLVVVDAHVHPAVVASVVPASGFGDVECRTLFAAFVAAGLVACVERGDGERSGRPPSVSSNVSAIASSVSRFSRMFPCTE